MKQKMETKGHFFRPVPFPYAIWPHEAGLTKASRRELFGMEGAKPPAEEVAAPKGGPAPEQPSLLSRVMDKFKLRRRTALQTAATVATNPSVAVGGIPSMVAQAALPAVGAATSAVAQVAPEALAHMVSKLQSAPSAGTWITLDGNAHMGRGLPLVRDAKTGLIGLLVHGASRIVGHVDGIGNNAQGTARAQSLHDGSVSAQEVHYGNDTMPDGWLQSPVTRRIMRMAGKYGRAAVTGPKYFEMMMQAYRNKGPNGGVTDTVKQTLPTGAQDGYGVYVLPAEMQSRHAGKPLTMMDGADTSTGAFELEPIPGEAEQYKRIHEAITKRLTETPQVADPEWGTDNLESILRAQTKSVDADRDLAERLLQRAQGSPEKLERLREAGLLPQQLDPNRTDLLSQIADIQTKNIEDAEDGISLKQAKDSIKEWKELEARAEAERRAKQDELKRKDAQKKEEDAKAAQNRLRQQRNSRWKTANLAERAQRGQTGANLYLPYERSFRNADLNRLEKALKQLQASQRHRP